MSHTKEFIGLFAVVSLTLGAPAAAAASRSVRAGSGVTPIERAEQRTGQAPAPIEARRERVPSGESRVIDLSAPATLIGEVRVRTDRQGRLFVLVDEWKDGERPDGIVDRAFLFQSEQPPTDRIDERLPLASVVFRGRSLFVSSPGTAFTLDLALGTDEDSRRSPAGPAFSLHDGVALQSRRVHEGGVGAWMDADDWEGMTLVIVGSGSAAAESTCDAGGQGSSSCNYKCTMAAATITKTDECAVTCRDGFYACCGCSVFYDATCVCMRDILSDPLAPSMGVDKY